MTVLKFVTGIGIVKCLKFAPAGAFVFFLSPNGFDVEKVRKLRAHSHDGDVDTDQIRFSLLTLYDKGDIEKDRMTIRLLIVEIINFEWIFVMGC